MLKYYMCSHNLSGMLKSFNTFICKHGTGIKRHRGAHSHISASSYAPGISIIEARIVTHPPSTLGLPQVPNNDLRSGRCICLPFCVRILCAWAFWCDPQSARCRIGCPLGSRGHREGRAAPTSRTSTSATTTSPTPGNPLPCSPTPGLEELARRQVRRHPHDCPSSSAENIPGRTSISMSFSLGVFHCVEFQCWCFFYFNHPPRFFKVYIFGVEHPAPF